MSDDKKLNVKDWFQEPEASKSISTSFSDSLVMQLSQSVQMKKTLNQVKKLVASNDSEGLRRLLAEHKELEEEEDEALEAEAKKIEMEASEASADLDDKKDEEEKKKAEMSLACTDDDKNHMNLSHAEWKKSAIDKLIKMIEGV